MTQCLPPEESDLAEIRLEDIERMGYQQLGVASVDKESPVPYRTQINRQRPYGAVAFWVLYSINTKTNEFLVGYVGEKHPSYDLDEDPGCFIG